MRFMLVNCLSKMRMTVLTEVLFICTDELTAHFTKYEAVGVGWLGRVMLSLWSAASPVIHFNCSVGGAPHQGGTKA